MKKYNLLIILSLFAFVGCNPEENQHDSDAEMPDFILADLDGKYEGFDTVVFNDESHVVLISHYPNKVVREYFIIHERDTMAIYYSKDGFPEYVTNGHEHIVVGGHSEKSLHVGVIDEVGNYDIYDWETTTNWVDYQTSISEAIHYGSDNHLINKEVDNYQSAFMGELYSFFLRQFSGKPWKPYGLLLWAGTSVAYACSDNPVWWATVDYVNKVGSNALLTFDVIDVVLANPEVSLLIGIGLVYAYDGYLIAEGIENGDFRLPFVKEPEMFEKTITNGIWWAGVNNVQLDWQAQQINAPIKVGKANFDYTNPDKMEIGVKKGITLPEGWSADVVPDGRDFCLKLSISENDKKGEIISFDIPVYVTGVSNIEEDLVYSVKQTPHIMLGNEAVYFDDLSSVTVEVTNYSQERGEIFYSPGWLDAAVNQTANGIITGLSLTPKTLDGAEKDKVVLAITSADGQGHYTVDLSVNPKGSDPFIYMNYILCPDQNHPHAIDLGLSVKWACCDVGASSPLEKGGYYAWGETETKEPKTSHYSWDSYIESDYKWYKTGEKIVDGVTYYLSGYYKYNTDPTIGYDGFTDGKTTLELDDDAAHVNWGGGWRMPTKEELDELMEKGSQSQYGASVLEYGGGFITGPNGNTILMNNKGCYGPTCYYTWGWYHANYWTSTLDPNEDSWWRGCAWGVAEERRIVGQAVRPVCN